MYLQEVRIENYRSIKDLHIKFKDNYALIVGANDHGKTNILKAIWTLFNLEVDENRKVRDLNFYYQNKRHDAGSSPLRMSFMIDNLPKGLLHTRKKMRYVCISVHFQSNGNVNFYFNKKDLSSHIRKHDEKAYSKYIEICKKFSVSYIPTFRNIEDHLKGEDSDSVLYNLLSKHLFKTVETQKGGSSREYRKVNKIVAEIQSLVKGTFDDIRDVTNKYTPSNVKHSYHFKYMPSSSEEVQEVEISKYISKNISIVNSKLGTPILNLGSGIQQAVTIGLMEKSILNSAKNNLILFEEPESFLHPSAQREIFLKLTALSKAPNVQMIFTSHSSVILDSADALCVGIVKRQNEYTDLFQIQESSLAIKKSIEDLEVSRNFLNSEVFFSDLVVFVEGPSDKYAFEQTMAKIAPNLQYRVSVLSCVGNSKFEKYVEFIEMFKNDKGKHLKWIIVTDKDSLKKKEVRDSLNRILHKKGNSLDWDSLLGLVNKKIPTDSDACLDRVVSKRITKAINKELFSHKIISLEGDIEFAILTKGNAKNILANMKLLDDGLKRYLEKRDLTSPDDLAKIIGSKGSNLDWSCPIPGQNKTNWKDPLIVRGLLYLTKKEDVSDELKNIIATFGKEIAS